MTNVFQNTLVDVNVGTAAGDHTGDTGQTPFQKVNLMKAAVNAILTGAIIVTASGDVTGAVDAANIQSAYNAQTTTSGTVQLLGGPYYVNAAVAPKSGVKLKGTTPQLNYSSIPDANTTLFTSGGGTVIIPTGAFAAVSWNTAVLGTPASQAAFSQAALTNISFEDIGFSGASGGTHGILAGNTNNPSCWYSNFINVFAIGFSTVGISITNYQHSKFFGNYTFNCAWGQYHGIDVASASLAPGNSTYYDLYNVNSSTLGNLSRGISFITTAALGAAADNNQFKMDRVQSNRFTGSTTSQAATMAAPIATVITNTSASIAATNTFAAGDPVGFSATTGTAGGQVLLNTTYYVSATGLSGSAFQVSATVGGAVITFNASGTPNVLTAKFTITSGAQWALNMPVTPSATQNGLALNTVYFITSISGTTLTVSKTYGGAPIPMTGNTAVNLTTQGFPCFEMIALAGSQQTNAVIDNIDVEGFSTAAMVFQNVNGFSLRVSQVPGTGQAAQSMVARGCNNGTTFSPQSMSTDWDNNAVGQAMGFFGARFGTCVGYMGYGIWIDSVSGKAVFSLGYQNDSQSGGMITLDPATAGGLATPKNAGIGHFIKNVNSAAFTITNLNCTLSNGTASGVTNTLPTVNAGNAGSWLKIINHTANPQTINTDGTQLFNGIGGRTSFTLNAGATVDLEAVQSTTGPAYTWDVTGGTSAMVAGVISAPS